MAISIKIVQQQVQVQQPLQVIRQQQVQALAQPLVVDQQHQQQVQAALQVEVTCWNNIIFFFSILKFSSIKI
jgi:hypothetical protein